MLTYIPSLDNAKVVEELPNIMLKLCQDAVTDVAAVTSAARRCQTFLVLLILRDLSNYIKHF